MAESQAFEWLSAELERLTTLSRLEARGTLRLVLKSAGLEPTSVTAHQLKVVTERLLATQLSKRKVDGADALCRRLSGGLAELASARPTQQQDAAYDVFSRLDSATVRKPKP